MIVPSTKLRPWQMDLMAAALVEQVKLIAVRGGKGCGKSGALVYLAMLLAVGRPGALVVLLANTVDRSRQLHHGPCRDLFRPFGAVWHASFREWRFPNGSTVRLRGYYDRGAGDNVLEGIEATAILADECQQFEPEFLEVATDRARQYITVNGVQMSPVVVLIGVPIEPCWWVERVREAGERVLPDGSQIKTRILLPRSDENAEAFGASWLAEARAVLGDEVFAESYENKPKPLTGNIYDCWRAETGPTGNLISGWRWRPEMHTVGVIDPGLGKPACILAAHDEALDAWVVFDEFSPSTMGREETTDEVLCELLRARWWPRRWSRVKPATVTYLVDELIIDPFAGRQRSRQGGGLTDIEVISWPVPGAAEGRKQYGFGIRPRVPAPERSGVREGITRVRMAMGRRQLLMTEQLWNAGIKAPQKHTTLARSIIGYSWRDGVPDKSKGYDDFADTIRYLVAMHMWTEHPSDRIAAAAQVYSSASRPLAWDA